MIKNPLLHRVVIMNLLIIGPQASGKGTQAERLAKKLGIEHISIGDVFRNEVVKKTKRGILLKQYMDKGELIPSDLNNKIVLEVLKKHPDGVLLDGYPRTQEQAEFLDANWHVEKVVVLEVSDDVCVERISGRRVCDKGHDYHIMYSPPKKEGICDIDHLKLHQRSDDTPLAIKKRLAIYHKQTEPIIKHFKKKVVKIDGSQSIDAVEKLIEKKLKI